MFLFLKPKKLTKTKKRETVDKLFKESAPSLDFFLLLVMSAIIVSLGFLLDNIIIIIGGMLITPILFPILSFAMGVVVGDFKLIKRSATILIQSIILVILISFVISLVSYFYIDKTLSSEVFSKIYPSLAYFLIAFVSGGAMAYALARPGLSEILPGVAISVSLIPPLTVIGIAFSVFKWQMMTNALELFFLNLLGIIFASLIVFALLKFYEVREAIEKQIKKEEKVIEEAKEEQEED